MLAFRSCGAKYNGSRRLSSVLSWASREEALANMCDAAAVQLPGPGRGHASLVQNHQLWSQSKRMVVTAASVSCLGTHSIRPVTTWCGALLTYCSGPGLTTQLTSAHLSTETYERERRKLPADRSGNILSLASEEIRGLPRLCQQDAVISSNFT